MVLQDGSVYEVPDLDEVFEPRDYADAVNSSHDFGLARGLMKAALDLPHGVPQKRTLEFLRVVDAAFRAGGPELWRNMR
jgi:hypothetical protein